MCSHGYHASPDGAKCVGEIYLLNIDEADWTLWKDVNDCIDDVYVLARTQVLRYIITKCHNREE